MFYLSLQVHQRLRCAFINNLCGWTQCEALAEGDPGSRRSPSSLGATCCSLVTDALHAPQRTNRLLVVSAGRTTGSDDTSVGPTGLLSSSSTRFGRSFSLRLIYVGNISLLNKSFPRSFPDGSIITCDKSAVTEDTAGWKWVRVNSSCPSHASESGLLQLCFHIR